MQFVGGLWLIGLVTLGTLAHRATKKVSGELGGRKKLTALSLPAAAVCLIPFAVYQFAWVRVVSYEACVRICACACTTVIRLALEGYGFVRFALDVDRRRFGCNSFDDELVCVFNKYLSGLPREGDRMRKPLPPPYPCAELVVQ